MKQGAPHSWPRYGRALRGHSKEVTSVAFSPNGLTVASGSKDSTVRIWNVTTGRMIGDPLEGHTDCVSSISYSHDNLRVVSGSHDGSVRVWDIETQTTVYAASVTEDGKSKVRVECAKFSHSGCTIAFCGWDATIRLADIWTGRKVVLSDAPENGQYPATRVAFSPSDTELISLMPDEFPSIRIWDLQRCALTARVPLGSAWCYMPAPDLSADGARVAIGSWGGLHHVWDARTGKAIEQPMEGQSASSTAVGLSADNSLFASALFDGSIRVWNAETGAALAGKYWGHSNSINSITFSPNGRLMASGANDCTVRLWDVHPDTAPGSRPPWKGHDRSVLSVAFSSDGAKLASGGAAADISGSSVIRIWDMSPDGAV